MAVKVAEEDFKRRARRRLMGAVALTILAIIILPLVLDKEPPPAGPLNIQMPVSHEPATTESAAPVPASAQSPAETTSADQLVAPPTAKPNVEARHLTSGTKGEASSKPVPKAGEGEYAVQVGAFADSANANRIKRRIQSLGLPAYTDRLGNATRVRVGPFKDKARAEKAAAKLAAVGLPVKLEGP
jgi:DedD protein